ncbi:MAG: PEGA domain-containing protein [Muribaculaceae bacterium]|nr:PEGA domain-containing protein [Muribaculaceae bacterium]
MRRFVLLLIACMMAAGVMAQTLCIEKEVEILPHNISASRNQRKDSKGLPCGLLMLHSTIEGLTFKGQTVGDVAYESGVYYIYLPVNAKKLEAIAPSGSVLKIDLPKIESKTTYEATVYYMFPKGSIICSSDPSGATVTLISAKERTNIGRTPLKGNAEVLSGVYDVEFSKPGYRTVVKNNVKVNAGKTTKLGTIKLNKL